VKKTERIIVSWCYCGLNDVAAVAGASRKSRDESKGDGQCCPKEVMVPKMLGNVGGGGAGGSE
jgi:hypothetical protein